MRRKLLLALVVAAAAVACGDQPFTIYNACRGTWAEVWRGNNEKLVARLDHGQVAPVELSAYQGTSMHFIAILHDVNTGLVVGDTDVWRTIPHRRRGFGTPTGPDDLRIWDIPCRFR